MGLEKIALGFGKSLLKTRMPRNAVGTTSGSLFAETRSSINTAVHTNPIHYNPIHFDRTLVRQVKKISFRKSKTVEEAKKFAKQNLGISDFEVQDIDGANCILEMLTDLQNQSGNLGLTAIKYAEHINLTQSKGLIAGSMDVNTGIMTLSNESQQIDFSSIISYFSATNPMLMLELQNQLKTITSNTNFLYLVESLKKKYKIPIRTIADIPFQTLKHELAHRLHYLKFKGDDINYWQLGKKAEIIESGYMNFDVFNEFKSEKIQTIIDSFPFLGSYAKESPCEFVAELYPVLLEGIEVPENIIKLYVKYKGPSVHNIRYDIS